MPQKKLRTISKERKVRRSPTRPRWLSETDLVYVLRAKRFQPTERSLSVCAGKPTLIQHEYCIRRKARVHFAHIKVAEILNLKAEERVRLKRNSHFGGGKSEAEPAPAAALDRPRERFEVPTKERLCPWHGINPHGKCRMPLLSYRLTFILHSHTDKRPLLCPQR